jgi:DnaJ-class molecular chaperone
MERILICDECEGRGSYHVAPDPDDLEADTARECASCAGSGRIVETYSRKPFKGG